MGVALNKFISGVGNWLYRGICPARGSCLLAVGKAVGRTVVKPLEAVADAFGLCSRNCWFSSLRGGCSRSCSTTALVVPVVLSIGLVAIGIKIYRARQADKPFVPLRPIVDPEPEEPVANPEPEPVVNPEPEPVVNPEPVVLVEPEPVVIPEPVVLVTRPEPEEPIVNPEHEEPVVNPEPKPTPRLALRPEDLQRPLRSIPQAPKKVLKVSEQIDQAMRKQRKAARDADKDYWDQPDQDEVPTVEQANLTIGRAVGRRAAFAPSDSEDETPRPDRKRSVRTRPVMSFAAAGNTIPVPVQSTIHPDVLRSRVNEFLAGNKQLSTQQPLHSPSTTTPEEWEESVSKL